MAHARAEPRRRSPCSPRRRSSSCSALHVRLVGAVGARAHVRGRRHLPRRRRRDRAQADPGARALRRRGRAEGAGRHVAAPRLVLAPQVQGLVVPRPDRADRPRRSSRSSTTRACSTRSARSSTRSRACWRAPAPRLGTMLSSLFLINFLILFGPLVFLGIQQIKAYEPGDADWGVKLDDVRGQAEAKLEITRVVSLWQSGEEFEKAGGKRERGVLFLGAPGTGKTMLSKAIATSFNCPFVTIPGSGFAPDVHRHGRGDRALPGPQGQEAGRQVGRPVHRLHRRDRRRRHAPRVARLGLPADRGRLDPRRALLRRRRRADDHRRPRARDRGLAREAVRHARGAPARRRTRRSWSRPPTRCATS